MSKVFMDEVSAKIEKLDRADRFQRATEREVERLIDRLRPGINYYFPDQYQALLAYFYSEDEKTKFRYLAAGQFNLGAYVFYRVPFCPEKYLVTLSQLSKDTGIDRTTMVKRIHNRNLPCQLLGKKVLYDIRQLRDLGVTDCQ